MSNTEVLKKKFEKPKVLTTRAACEKLGITRWFFEIKVKPQLTKLEKVGCRNVYLLEEIEAFKKTAGKIVNTKYNVVD